MPKEYGGFFRMIQRIVRLGIRRYQVIPVETTIPKEPAVLVSLHQNMGGPIQVLAWYPSSIRTWVLHVFFSYTTCYQQYVAFTFTKRARIPSLLSKVLAAPAAWFATTLTKSSKAIPVYRSRKQICDTMEESIEALISGEQLLIFPDVAYDDSSSTVQSLYSGFLHLERAYKERTGKHLPFVPVYADATKRELRIGKPLYFTGEMPFSMEKKVMVKNLQHALQSLT